MTLGERIVTDLRSDVFSHLMRPVGRLLRRGALRRADLAPHRRHHADQVGGRRQRLRGAQEPRPLHRRLGDDGGDEPAPLRPDPPGHSGDRAAASSPSAAMCRRHSRYRAGPPGRRLRLCRRGGGRRAHRPGLHAGSRRDAPLLFAGGEVVRRGAHRHRVARQADGVRHLPGLRQRRRGAVVGRACGAGGRDERRAARAVRALLGVRRRRARRAQPGVGRGEPGGRRHGAHRRAAGDEAAHRKAGAPRAAARAGARRRSPSTTSISATTRRARRCSAA